MLSTKKLFLTISLALFTTLSFAHPINVAYIFESFDGITDMQKIEETIREVKISTLKWLSSKYKDLGHRNEELKIFAHIDSEFEQELKLELAEIARKNGIWFYKT